MWKVSNIILVSVILQFSIYAVASMDQSGNKAPSRKLNTSRPPDRRAAQQSGADKSSTSSIENRPQLMVQLAHVVVDEAAFSPDGRFVLTTGGQAMVLWDVETCRELRRFEGHSGAISSIAYSPDGRFALSGGEDGVAILWDVATGKQAQRFSGHSGMILAVAFSPDGRFILTGGYDSQAVLWSTATGEVEQVYQGHSNCVRSVAYSPDGRFVLTGSTDCRLGAVDATARLWDAKSGKELRRFDGYGREGMAAGINFLAFSPDSRSAVISGVSLQSSFRLIDLSTGQIKWELSDSVNYAAFSPDGKFIATATIDRAHLLDAATGKEVREFVVNTGTVNFVKTVAYSPDGRFVLTGFKGNALLWNAATGEVVKQFKGDSNSVSNVAFSPDGKFIVAEPNRPLDKEIAVLWEAGTGKVAQTFELKSSQSPIPTYSTFSLDGRYLLLSDNRIWDLSTGNVVQDFKKRAGLVKSAAFSPDGRFILFSNSENRAILFDITTGQEIRRFIAPVRQGYVSDMNSVCFSPDGRYILSGSFDSIARLWDVATGKEERRFVGHERSVNSVAFSPDGRLALTASSDNTARLWDVATGSEVQLFHGHVSRITGATFSPDGGFILTTSLDSTVRLWDVKTAKEIRRLQGLVGRVESISFSPDGRFILTAGNQPVVQLWNASSGIELCRLISFRDGRWVVVDPEGRFDASDLDEIKDLHWIVPDDPFKPLALELFMREYYEPQLLRRILAGEKFKQTKSLFQLNRVQPTVSITDIRLQPNAPDLVTVSVEVSRARGEFQQGGRKVSLETGVFDLRLFRDGQLVGYASESGGEIKLDPNTGKTVINFTNIKLPRRGEASQVEFSAYAFNTDRIKSATDRKSFDIRPTTSTRGRAYLITVGVNAYEQSDFDLSFAANDARRVQSIVSDRILAGGQYTEIIRIPLISDYEIKAGKRVVTERTATKNNLKAVFDLLSGKQVPAELISTIPNADKIKEARPEDFVLISFSSHGFADDSGNFYFVPYDTGQISGQQITQALIRRCISSDEMALWLRDVDAGEMVMIVDACHSAATVAADGFKPGPMGSRGLGQLAYDKRMRILTSTQADDVALESELIRQGLLTYALTHDGIEARQADYKPKDQTITLAEWLEYGVRRVPSLYEEVKKGELQDFGRGKDKRGLVVLPATQQKSLTKKAAFQQPSLFDFSKKKSEMILVKRE